MEKNTEKKRGITGTAQVAFLAMICCVLWGSAFPCVKIGYELRKKAIPAAYIDEALATIPDETYTSDLTALLRAKLKTIKAKDDRERYYKLLRFAAGRGFSAQEANACICSLLKNTDEYETTME